MVPGGRSGQIFEIFEILGGAGDINNSTSMPNYCDGPFSDLGECVNNVLIAWAEVWSGSYRSTAKVLTPEGRSGQIFEIFEILGGAGDINNSISMPNYCDGPFSDLGKCVNKVRSAWTEVWSATCRSSRRFWFPGVVFGGFSRFFLRFWEGLVI